MPLAFRLCGSSLQLGMSAGNKRHLILYCTYLNYGIYLHYKYETNAPIHGQSALVPHF